MVHKNNEVSSSERAHSEDKNDDQNERFYNCDSDHKCGGTNNGNENEVERHNKLEAEHDEEDENLNQEQAGESDNSEDNKDGSDVDNRNIVPKDDFFEVPINEEELKLFCTSDNMLPLSSQKIDLEEPEQLKLTGIIEEREATSTIISEYNKKFEEVQKSAKNMESKENSKLDKEVKKVESQINKQLKVEIKKITEQQKKKIKENRLDKSQIEIEAKKEIYPMAKRYDKELRMHYIQGMKHVMNLRHTEMLALQKNFSHSELNVLENVDKDELKSLEKKHKEKIKEIENKRGVFDRIKGKEKEELVHEKEKEQKEFEKQVLDLKREHERRREEFKKKEQKIIEEMEEKHQKVVENLLE